MTKTIVASFLHLMVLFFKVIFNHILKHQFFGASLSYFSLENDISIEIKELFITIWQHFEKQHHKMQETCNNCFWSKNVAQPFVRRKQVSTSAEMYVAVTCEFLASYDVSFQSVVKSFLKTPVFGATLSYYLLCSSKWWKRVLFIQRIQ